MADAENPRSGQSPAGDNPDDVVTIGVDRGWNTEDWWANFVGLFVLLSVLAVTLAYQPADLSERQAAYEAAKADYAALLAAKADDKTLESANEKVVKAQAALAVNPLQSYLAKPSGWTSNPGDAFVGKKKESLIVPIVRVFLVTFALFGVAVWNLGGAASARGFPVAFLTVFLLATVAYVASGQVVINNLGLEYALWALLGGLLISNTIGTPEYMKPALRTELYIKAGLVLYGAEVLLDKLVALGMPGIFIAWVVTPIVLISTYIFGQRVLKIPSRSLNMVICADMSVCGVSAAIATAAACRAKKEELSLAISLSLGFTVIMMIALPAFIKAVGIDPVLGGAWIGGTIDSTGAVAAAGAALGPAGELTATMIKTIQNILIGVIAFSVAVYWVTCVERRPGDKFPSLWEIWRRFPKFVLGFLLASLLFTWLTSTGPTGEATTAAISKTSGQLRGWCFCLAFVSIGLESNFRELSKQLVGGKPLILYVCGQALNVLLTFLMAWLMFTKVFPDAAAALR